MAFAQPPSGWGGSHPVTIPKPILDKRGFKGKGCDVRDLDPVKFPYSLGKVKGKTKKLAFILFWKGATIKQFKVTFKFSEAQLNKHFNKEFVNCVQKKKMENYKITITNL